MFVADTNLLVYAANESCPEHKRCRALVEKWRSQSSAWYVTWGILYGFVRITTHPKVLPNPWQMDQALQFVEALLSSPGLRILKETDRHFEVLREIQKEGSIISGNLITDLHIAVLMREHGIKVIFTRDVDFHRFPFLEVRDPLK